jgi:hypothetical protein
MRVDTRSRHRNSGRPPEKDAKAFLQWLRGRPCVFADQGGCKGKMEAAHLDFAGGKGIGTKVADRYSVPMCSAHHALQHRVGWMTFIGRMGAAAPELMVAAARLWNAWPGRPAWERKQREAA